MPDWLNRALPLALLISSAAGAAELPLPPNAAQTIAQANATPAAKAVDPPGRPPNPWMLRVYFENDLFSNTDRDYTDGIKLAWVSPNLSSFDNDPQVHDWVRWLSRQIGGWRPRDSTSRNLVVTLGQAMYTPTNRTRVPADPKDRPYAGWLYLGLGYNGRQDPNPTYAKMETFEIDLGIVGPHAYAKQTQDFVHDARGVARFDGWDSQLHDEPGVLLVYEAKHRRRRQDFGRGLEADLIGHYGVAFGNVADYANAGFELRFGRALPNDFGTAPIRPAGDDAAPTPPGEARKLSGNHYGLHAYFAVDVKAVAHNIFLNGNTFGNSPGVTPRPLVAEAAVGFAVSGQRWKVTYGHFWRSKEFWGQTYRHRYGSVTASFLF